jgi:transmembrane sensor
LGTQFRVYEHEDETDIGVLQGEVSIRARSTPRLASQPPVHLDAGEGATVVSTQNTVTIRAERLSRGDLERALAWREGALEFHGNSLKEAVSQINRYNVRQLVIIDPTIENLSVGGRFRYSDFNRAVDTLTIGKQVIVDKSDTSIIRLRGPQMGLGERYDQHTPH